MSVCLLCFDSYFFGMVSCSCLCAHCACLSFLIVCLFVALCLCSAHSYVRLSVVFPVLLQGVREASGGKCESAVSHWSSLHSHQQGQLMDRQTDMHTYIQTDRE